MIVVADSGPLISLALIGKLDMPETIYGEMYISETVWQEVSHYIEPFNIPHAKGLEKKVQFRCGLQGRPAPMLPVRSFSPYLSPPISQVAQERFCGLSLHETHYTTLL
jgi:hypothetical protein